MNCETETLTAADATIRVARQPILDRSQRTVGYELLFRDSSENRARVGNADEATANVIVSSFMELGIERLTGGAPAFINVGQNFINAGHCRSLPREKVVLEILEDTIPDANLIAELRRLRSKGYKVALDDFNFQDNMEALIPLADIVKVDLRQVESERIPRLLSRFDRVTLMWLAEKVETVDEFRFCRNAGFHYFQGYFFCTPHIVSSSTVRASRLSLFRLIAELHDPDVDARRIEKVIGQDLGLSYKVLRYVNSAFVGLPHIIESIGHAIRLAGVEYIRQLATLIMLSRVSEEPKELINVSLIRAKMCELLGARSSQHMNNPFFTVGLFSTLDAFLGWPMEEALASLPLSDRVRDALLKREGVVGHILNAVLHFERDGAASEADSEMEPKSLQDAYWTAVAWQQQLLGSLA